MTEPTVFFTSNVRFPIEGFLRVHHLFGMHKPFDKIERLKGIHKGRRCFVVSTGPSLTVEDVEKLEDKITISMNSIFKMYNKTNWRPNYYMCCDISLYDSFNEIHGFDVASFAKEYSIYHFRAMKYLRDEKKIIYTNVNWLDHWTNANSSKFKYNPNLLYGIYDFYTVTVACIMLAMYMGIKEIYLLGTDNNYGGNSTHFGGDAAKESVALNKHEKNLQDSIDFAIAAGCIKHSIEGDFNLTTVDEIESLMQSGGNGRIQR